jgi:hypothetical protein
LCFLIPRKSLRLAGQEHGRAIPLSDVRIASFDHLAGTGKHTRRYFQAECFGSLDVEHGFVFRRSLHREVGWFLAFQDAVDVGGGKPIQRGLINPEGDQSAFGDETAEVCRMEP